MEQAGIIHCMNCAPSSWRDISNQLSVFRNQANRPTAILAVSVTGGTPAPRRRGTPGGCPGVGQADEEGRHEACSYVAIELRKV